MARASFSDGLETKTAVNVIAKMTTKERDALVPVGPPSGVVGMMIYNTDADSFQKRVASGWVNF